MDEQLKQKIKIQVELYKDLNPEEYQAVCELVIEKRKMSQNELAAMSGDHVIERLLGEYPEILYGSLINSLEPHEMVIFNKKPTQRWFFTTYPEFRVSAVI